MGRGLSRLGNAPYPPAFCSEGGAGRPRAAGHPEGSQPLPRAHTAPLGPARVQCPRTRPEPRCRLRSLSLEVWSGSSPRLPTPQLPPACYVSPAGRPWGARAVNPGSRSDPSGSFHGLSPVPGGPEDRLPAVLGRRSRAQGEALLGSRTGGGVPRRGVRPGLLTGGRLGER